MAGSAGSPQCGKPHPDIVAFAAQAVKADPATLESYDWAGRTIKRHQAEIRAYFGFRVYRKTARGSPGELAGDTAQRARRFELVREVFLVACRERQL
jgi:hypothetical protein